MMVEHRAFSESVMAERIRQGIADGDLPADTDFEMLAAYFSAVARDGGSREKPTEIGRLAMRAWRRSDEWMKTIPQAGYAAIVDGLRALKQRKEAAANG
jgi:hypothetical protein